MSDPMLITPLITGLILFGLGYWFGRFREQGRQGDLRIQYSESDEFKALAGREQLGALAMWNWLKEKS